METFWSGVNGLLEKPEAKKPDTKPEGPEPMIEDKREEKKPGKKNADGTCKWGEC